MVVKHELLAKGEGKRIEVRNKRWSEEQLFAMRHEVLSWWPTAREIDLDEAIAYRRSLPTSKVWVDKLARGKKAGRPLLHPMVGHATVEDTLDHAKALEEAGADLLMIFPDAYTRGRRYEDAQRAVEESVRQGKSLLNGYPIVNHGVKETRRLTDNLNTPLLYLTSSDADPRLNAETTFAAGLNGQAHDLHDLIQHVKSYPLDQKIINTQYANRLIGYYTERGAPIDVLIPANLCGWDPPGMKIVLNILESLLAAEQGVKHMDEVLIPTCNIVQDVAGLQVMRKLTAEYLQRFGYHDVTVSVCGSSWQGDWPKDHYRAAGLAAISAIAGTLGGADYLVLRSLQEASAVATKETNVAALRVCQQVIATLGRERLPESPELKLEEEMTAKEVRAIVDRVIELGDGDVAVGQIRAVQTGELDASFPCWVHVKGKVLPVRDRSGAIRYLEHGDLPLPKDVVQYHRQKIAARAKADGMKADLDMVIHDVTALSR